MVNVLKGVRALYSYYVRHAIRLRAPDFLYHRDGLGSLSFRDCEASVQFHPYPHILAAILLFVSDRVGVDRSGAELRMRDRTLDEILGPPDDMQFRSSMTLFAMVDPEDPLLQAALDRLRILNVHRPWPPETFYIKALAV